MIYRKLTKDTKSERINGTTGNQLDLNELSNITIDDNILSMSSNNSDTINWVFAWLSSNKTHECSQDTSYSEEGSEKPVSRSNKRPFNRSRSYPITKRRKNEGGEEEGSDERLAKEVTNLKEIAEELRIFQVKAEEREKNAEKRERKAEARAKRIESLLHRVLEKQEKVPSIDYPKEKEAVPRNARRPWSAKERDLVVMGYALYGRDCKALCNLLEDRNRNQLCGFLSRNWNKINEEIKKYPASTEEEAKAVLAAIERRQEEEEGVDDDDDDNDDDDDEEEDDDDHDDEEEEEDDDDDDDEEEDDDDDNEENDLGDKKVVNIGTWSAHEREKLIKGISLHGNEDFKALSAFVKTRSPNQTKMYFYRRLRDSEAPKRKALQL